MSSHYNFKDNLTIDNDRFLKWYNATNTRQDIIGLDASNNLSVNDGGGDISINPSGTSHTFINSGNTGLTIVDSSLGVGYATTANTNSTLTIAKNGFISVNSVSGANDGLLGFTAGDSLDTTAGSHIISYGEEHSTLGGHTEIYTGNSGELSLYTGPGAKRAQILNDGTTNFMPNGSTIRLSIDDTTSTFNHLVHISDTTEAINATTGALTVAGGLGVLGNTHIDGTLSINSIVGNLEFNSTRPSLSYSSGSITVEGGFGIQSTVDVASVTSGGGLSVAGGIALGKSMIMGGNLTIESTTLSTDSQTGSLIVYGGVGLNKTVYQKAVAPNMNFSPLTTGNETSIHFYPNNDFTEAAGTSGGWHLGHNALSVGVGAFSIGHHTNPRFTLHSDGRTIISSDTGGQVTSASDGLALTTVNATTFVANTDITAANRQFAVFNGSTTDNTFSAVSFQSSAGGTADFKFVGSSVTLDRKIVSTIDNVDVLTLNASGQIDIPDTTSIGGSTNITAIGDGALNVGGDVTIGAGQMIHIAQGGLGAPAFTTRSAGTKLILYPEISASTVDYAIGIESGILWSSVPTSGNSFKWYGGTTEFGSWTGTGLTLQTPEIIDVTSTEAFLVRQDSDGGDVFTVDTTNSRVEIGTASSITGTGALSIHGTQASGNAASIVQTTTQDVYPVMQYFGWEHDTGAILFDSYYDGSNFRSSDPGSNFGIYKNLDLLRFIYNTGDAQGATIGNFYDFIGMQMDTTGLVTFQQGAIVDQTSTDAFRVRKDGGGALVFRVDTLNSNCIISNGSQVAALAQNGLTIREDNSTVFSAGVDVNDANRMLVIRNDDATLNNFAQMGMRTGDGTNDIVFDQILVRDGVSTGKLVSQFTSVNTGGNTTIDILELNYNGIITANASMIIDETDTEAFLIRKESDGGDVFTVNTVDGSCLIGPKGTNYFRLISSGGINYLQSGITDTTSSIAPLYITGINGTPIMMTIDSTGTDIYNSLLVEGNQVIDVTNTEALLVRKNADGGDVFVVDTTNEIVAANANLLVDGSNTEALLVRKDSDGGDVFVVDTTNEIVSANASLLVDSSNTEAFLVRKNGDSGDIFVIDTVDEHVCILATTVSTSTTTGALKISGGVGIEGSLYVGGVLHSDSTFELASINLDSTTAATNFSTGSLVTLGGITIAGTENATSLTNGGGLLVGGGAGIGKDVYIGGNLDVIGATNNFGAVQVANNDSGVTYLQVAGSRTNGEYQSLYVTGWNKTPIIAEFNETAPSVSKSTGSLVVRDGGIGIGGTSDATSITAGGALTVAGGMAIAGAGFVGGTLQVGDNTVTPQEAFVISTEAYGANKDHGLRVSVNDASSTSHINYRYIDLRLISNGSSTYRGALLGTLGGGAASEFEFITLNQTGILDFHGVSNFLATDDSSSSATGSVVVFGGLGVAKNLYIDDTLIVDATNNRMILANGSSTGVLAQKGLTIRTDNTTTYVTNSDIGDPNRTLVVRNDDSTINNYSQIGMRVGDGTHDIILDQVLIRDGVSTGKMVYQFNSINTAGNTAFDIMELNYNGSVLANATVTIDDTNTEALLVRKDSDGGDILAVDTTNTSLKLGPGAGIQNSLLSLYGPQSSTSLGPHIMCTTDQDTYPTFQLFNVTHDNIALHFDMYWDGLNYRSSDAGSNFMITKLADKLQWQYDSGIVQGGVPVMNVGMTLDSTGVVSIPTSITVPNTVNISSASEGAVRVNGDLTLGAGRAIHFPSTGLAPPSYTTRSAGTRLVIYPSVNASQVDMAIGMDSGTMWMSVADSTNWFTWYSETTEVMRLGGDGLLTVQGGEIIDVTSTEALLVRKDSDGGDVLTVDTTNSSLKLGPGAGIQNSLVSLYGTVTSGALGPHIMATTTEDIYPVFQQFNYSHDSIHLLFDCYFDNSAVFRSSDVGSNFRIVKQSDELTIYYSSGTAQGSIPTQSKALGISSAGVVQMEGNTIIDNTSTEAFLVRKNTDGGDVFTIDTTNSIMYATVGDTYIRQGDTNTSETRIFIGGGLTNQRKTAIITDPDNSWGQGSLHICQNNVESLEDVTVSDSCVEITSDGNVIIDNTSTEAFLIRKNSDGGDVLTVDTSGDIITTLAAINITNTVNATSNTSGGALTIGGGCAILKDAYVGGTFFNSSDRRLKSDITPVVESVLPRVEALEAVTYKHNKEVLPHSSDDTLYGLIAQDVLEQFPLLVKRNGASTGEAEADPEAYLNLDYTRLNVVLLKAVQELSERVKSLEARCN